LLLLAVTPKAAVSESVPCIIHFIDENGTVTGNCGNIGKAEYKGVGSEEVTVENLI